LVSVMTDTSSSGTWSWIWFRSIPARGCINHLIMNVKWFLRKVFRTNECSWLLPITGTLWWDEREMMTCRIMSVVA
jgi:hypothetical protein